MQLDSERALVERARVDTEAFSELYRHYLPRIHSFAWRRTGDRQVAEDICAATFESAFRGIGQFRWRRGGFAPWLFRIAANAVADHYRREGRVASDRGQLAIAALHEPEQVEAEFEAVGEDHTQLREALDALNPRYQRAIALRYLADLDADEAARAMGLTKPALAVVLSRALKALRRELERNPSNGGDGS